MRKRFSSSSSNQGAMTKELSDGIKAALGKNVRILLKCAVKLESKGDKTENRILVFCPCRLFCFRIPNPKIDFHFHYLEIQTIESKKPNQLVLTANDKTHSFVITDPEKVDMVDKMIVTLLTTLSETFPGIPLYNIVRRIDVVPAKRLQHLDFSFDGGSSSSSGGSVPGTATNTPLPYPKSKSTSSLGDEAASIHLVNSTSSSVVGIGSGTGSLDRSLSISAAAATTSNYQHVTVSCGGPGGTSGPCGGFSTQYAWMCDLHGLPYREEVAWDVDTIYLSHDSRELCLHDFDHLEPRDSVPILSALEYNTWFKSLRASNVKLSHEAMDRFLHVVRKSLTIEELHLDNIGAKTDFAHKLSTALSSNANSQVHTLDLSHNMIEDKGAIHLSNPIAKLCRGPVWLNLSQCGLSAKGVAQLAHALVLNRCAPNSLTHLNLSGNSLKDDINNLCNFLAQPNSITFLDLSGTDCTLETVFGALLRGCTSHLAHLNLSRNNFSTKKGKEIPPSFKQFLTSSLALKHLSLSSCKLSLEALKQLLLGLACNESTADLELDVSTNGLGQQGAHVLESCLHGIKCLASLDISENNLESDLAGVITAVSKNKSLKHLYLGRNLQSTKAKHVAQVMEAIVQVLQDEDCVLQTLSLADSKLKGELYSVINALGSNQCVQNIDISGNQMGDVGARLLAKALQINSKLKCITYDRNNITLQGFSDIAYGLESNMSVRYMPFPVHDSLPCMKVSGEKTEAVMKRIQDLIYRNSQPKKTSSGQQAFRLQQGFLLSSAQQTVDKLVSQTHEAVKLLRKNEINNPSTESGGNAEVVIHAERLIQDSEKAKQLLVNLHEMIEQKGEAGKVIESKLQQISDDLHTILSEHIQGNIDHVLELTEEKCPNLMGDESLREEMKLGCIDKSGIPSEFVRHCVMDLAGTDIINKVNEVHLAVAAHISDKLVDRAIDSLMKCHKQLNDASKKRSSTPDVLKTRLRSSPGEISKEAGDSVFSDGSFLSDHSPMKLDYLNLATPQLHAKRKGLHGRRIRPKSVVDCIEGISADDIPDLLPSLPRTIEETIENLTGLPPVIPQQLKHLGKARPKKPKSRAPTRPCLRATEVIEEVSDLQEGLDTFFRPGSTTPTPIVTPDSDECSTSLMISSMTSAADDSIVSTPTHSSRTFKADENCSDKTSPSSFDSCSIASKLSLEAVPRSKSTDCLEKPGYKRETLLTPTNAPVTETEDGQKSPIQKLGISMGPSVLAEMKARQEKRSSVLFPISHAESSSVTTSTTVTTSKVEEKETTSSSSTISTGVSVTEAKEKFLSSHKSFPISLVNRRPPPVAPKPRPWSVVGSDRRSGDYSLGSDGTSPSTPDSGEILDDSIGSTGNGKVSPLSSAAVEASTGKPSSEAMSLPPTSSVSATISSNLKQTSTLLSSSTTSSTTGGISINFSSRNSPISLLSSSPKSIPTPDPGPVSLPAWAEKRSVKQLAASLTRQEEVIKKKADSLPRNASPPTHLPPPIPDVVEQPQDFNRARVSIQEWSRHHSISEVWKAPLRKLSGESNNRPVSKRWEVNNEKSVNNGLRKTSKEDEGVNV